MRCWTTGRRCSPPGPAGSRCCEELSLLTAKPFLYVFNADESVLTDDARRAELAAAVAPADAVFLDAKVEFELLELDEESAPNCWSPSASPSRGCMRWPAPGFTRSACRPT